MAMVCFLPSRATLKSQNKLKGDRVVATSMSNLGLERVLARENIALARAAVGDRYVLEEMLRSGNVLGGEQSGHIIFLDDSPAGDGLLTAAKIASLVSMHGKIESLVEGFKDYPQLIVNVKVRSKPPLGRYRKSLAPLAEAQSALGDSGRVVLRYFRHRTARPRHGRSRTRSRCPPLQPVPRQRPPLLHRCVSRPSQRSSAYSALSFSSILWELFALWPHYTY